MTSDRADKSDLGDETPRARDPGELAVVAKERERVFAENAEEIRKLGKRVGRDVIEIGRRLTGMKKLCGHGNWLPWLEREFGWTDRHALNYTRVYELSLKSENFSDLEIPVNGKPRVAKQVLLRRQGFLVNRKRLFRSREARLMVRRPGGAPMLAP
jgi:Protein of unknown function (DUF3102)